MLWIGEALKLHDLMDRVNAPSICIILKLFFILQGVVDEVVYFYLLLEYWATVLVL